MDKAEMLGNRLQKGGRKSIKDDKMKVELEIIKQHGSYIVRRVGGDYSFHAHIKLSRIGR